MIRIPEGRITDEQVLKLKTIAKTHKFDLSAMIDKFNIKELANLDRAFYDEFESQLWGNIKKMAKRIR